jgi:hypothetical protein
MFQIFVGMGLERMPERLIRTVIQNARHNLGLPLWSENDYALEVQPEKVRFFPGAQGHPAEVLETFSNWVAHRSERDEDGMVFTHSQPVVELFAEMVRSGFLSPSQVVIQEVAAAKGSVMSGTVRTLRFYAAGALPGGVARLFGLEPEEYHALARRAARLPVEA